MRLGATILAAALLFGCGDAMITDGGGGSAGVMGLGGSGGLGAGGSAGTAGSGGAAGMTGAAGAPGSAGSSGTGGMAGSAGSSGSSGSGGSGTGGSVPPTPPGPDLEQRCADLGAVCYRSEPLTTSFGPSNNISQLTDAKACDGGLISDGLPGDEAFHWIDPNASGVGTPSGSEVPHVLRVTQGPNRDGADAFLCKDDLDVEREASSATFCARSYKRWHPSIPVANGTCPPCDRTRVHSVNFNIASGAGGSFALAQISLKGGDVQMRFESFADDNVSFIAPFSWDNGGGAPQMSDCQDSWCRFELCVDFESNFIQVRGEFEDLGDGRTAHFSRTSNQPGRSSLQLLDSLLTFYNPRDNFNSAQITNEQYISFFMDAWQTPMDSSFWIGSSSEFEGP